MLVFLVISSTGTAKTLQPACRQAIAIGGVLRDVAQHSRSIGAQASSVQRSPPDDQRPLLAVMASQEDLVQVSSQATVASECLEVDTSLEELDAPSPVTFLALHLEMH